MLVNVHDAKTQFSKLLEQAHAGQEIILAKAGKPYARMMPLAPEAPKRQRGRVKSIKDDAFFDPLPEEELAAWLAILAPRNFAFADHTRRARFEAARQRLAHLGQVCRAKMHPMMRKVEGLRLEGLTTRVTHLHKRVERNACRTRSATISCRIHRSQVS